MLTLAGDLNVLTTCSTGWMIIDLCVQKHGCEKSNWLIGSNSQGTVMRGKNNIIIIYIPLIQLS